MQVYTEGYPYLWVNGGHDFGKGDDGTVEELINWYNQSGGKGIVALQWHWHSPSGGEAGTNTFYTSLTDFDVTRAVTPGTQEYNDIIRDIDDVALKLKIFSDAGVPVLWRPLHEAGGGWFWWGAKGPGACLALYDILFDRMVNHHQLHNLLWVWSTPEEEWYPGNNKVDIIGYDSYPGSFNYGSQKNAYDQLYSVSQGKKMIAMTENGPIPDPEECFRTDAPWLYFMSWSNLVSEQNSQQHILDVYGAEDVLTLESDNVIPSGEWRSLLYPEDWKPGFKDSRGRFLQDFSYAGYHQGMDSIPFVEDNILDVSKAPYNADNTGINDVTSIIQQAIDDAGNSGGGVVYLPTGTYRIKRPVSSDYTLRISGDRVVLRGAGPDSTFLFHDETQMRYKEVILIRGEYAGWFVEEGASSPLTYDIPEPSRIIPVESTDGFNSGEEVIIRSLPTEAFIAEHKMEDIWTAGAIKGVAFKRKIISVDTSAKVLIIDSPTRYPLKTRDGAMVHHAKKHLTETGIENLSIANRENPKPGWDEESYTAEGTGAWDVHFCHLIRFDFCQDSWVKNVYTYKPEVNLGDFHLLSNGILLDQCRNITIDSCDFQKPQYEGGGGNGYLFTLQSNDCLISNCRANDGRHNYDFKYPYSNGNVIHHCRMENSKYASDFHMYLSMSNLFDDCTVDGDYLESSFRPYGGDAIHGYTSSQSVFYNTKGVNYHPSHNYIIESRQFGMGYIIGTSGPASDVLTTPESGMANSYFYDTAPVDYTEGLGNGADLVPQSLYLDQLEKRKNRDEEELYRLEIRVYDSQDGKNIQDARVKIFNREGLTDQNGITVFEDSYGFVIMDVERAGYFSLHKSLNIFSDTTFSISLQRKEYSLIFEVLNSLNSESLWGATVSIGSQTGNTDRQGLISFTSSEEEINWRAKTENFAEASGQVFLHSDTGISIFLTRTHANIRIFLKEGSTPVVGAVVYLDSDSLISNLLGMTNFSHIPVGSPHSYLVKKEGYFPVAGELTFNTDTSMELSILPDNTSIGKAGSGEIKIWPNPAVDQLNGSIPGNDRQNKIIVSDITGRIWINFIPEDTFFSIPVNHLPPGIYILRHLSTKLNNFSYFVKE